MVDTIPTNNTTEGVVGNVDRREILPTTTEVYDDAVRPKEK